MSGLRVLLSAYQCAPGGGSASQIGWEWFTRLAARGPVTLVTHVRNRPAILAADASKGADIVFIDTEWFAGPLYRLATMLFPRSEHAVFMLSQLDFFLYDRIAAGELEKRQARGDGWDVVHVATPVSPLAASRLHRLGAPLVRGPLNGGMAWPENFEEIRKQDAGWVYGLRHLARLFNRGWTDDRHAAALLCANRRTAATFPASLSRHAVLMPEIGVDLSLFHVAPLPGGPDATTPLRILFVGRLVPFKGVAMLLEAVRRASRDAPMHLSIVGGGPMEAAWRAKAEELGIAPLVRFHGAAPFDEIRSRMADAHVVCLPSIRESGGSVLIEAMAAGRPVIALDHGGPSEIVTPEVGLLVPCRTPRDVEAGLTDALLNAARNPELWRRKARNARKRAEALYSWDVKVAQAEALFSRLASGSVVDRRAA